MFPQGVFLCLYFFHWENLPQYKTGPPVNPGVTSITPVQFYSISKWGEEFWMKKYSKSFLYILLYIKVIPVSLTYQINQML